MTTTAPPTDITIATPANWATVDLQALESEEPQIERSLAEVADAPDAEVLAADLAHGMARAARASQDAGVIYAAALVDQREGFLSLAAMTLAVVPMADPGADPVPAQTAEHIAAELADADRAMSQDVSIIELSVGPTVRVKRVDAEDDEGREGLARFSCEYFVPIPGAGHLAVATFVTPSFAVAEQMEALFDAIAATLQFHWS